MPILLSYRHTEAGTRAIVAKRLAEERRRLMAEKEAKEAAERALAESKAIWERAINARIAAARTAEALMRRQKPFQHTYRSIEARAMRVFGVTRAELNSQRRNREIIPARQFIMYWCCRVTAMSMPQIGNMMGGRDHTTVLKGRRAYVAKRAKMGRCLREPR